MAPTAEAEAWRFSYATGGSGLRETETGFPEYDAVVPSTCPSAGLSSATAKALPWYSVDLLSLLSAAVAKICWPQSTGTR